MLAVPHHQPQWGHIWGAEDLLQCRGGVQDWDGVAEG